MISQDQKQFLKDLEVEISIKFRVSKFQVKIMLQALKAKKPQYEIVRKLQSKEFFDNYEDEEEIDPQFCLELEVYDTQQKNKLFIEIYFLNDTSLPQEKLLKRQVEIVQAIPQTHLVMRPINCYTLDPLIYYSDDQDFLVIEYDMYDFTFNEFCGEFEIEDDQLEEYLRKQANICEDISQIGVDHDNLLDCFFVYINQVNKSVQIKLNLINLVDETEAETRTYSDLIGVEIDNLQTQINELGEEEEEINRKLGIVSEEKREIAWNYTLRLRENNYAELTESDTALINKENLLEQLQLSVPSETLSTYDPLIFDAILNDQNYKHFQLNLMSKHHFLFKITRTDEEICYLEGKKINSLEESQQLEQQYQSMVSYNSMVKVLDSEKITTINSVRLINLSDANYLLIENSVRISRFNDEYETLDEYLNVDEESNFNEEEFKSLLQRLFKLFELSKQLFDEHEIKITSINPNNIIIQLDQTDIDDENEQETSLLITYLDNGDFINDYVNIVDNIIGMVHPFSIDLFVQKVVRIFFESISRNDLELVKQLYVKIRKTLSNLEKVKQLETDLQDEYQHIKTELHLEDDSDQLEKVYAHLKVQDKIDLKDLYRLLKENQFNNIYLDLKRTQLFPKYDLKESAKKQSTSMFSSLVNSIQDAQKSQITDSNIGISTKPKSKNKGVYGLRDMIDALKPKEVTPYKGIFSSLFNTEVECQKDIPTKQTGIFANVNHVGTECQNEQTNQTESNANLFTNMECTHEESKKECQIQNLDLFQKVNSENTAKIDDNSKEINIFQNKNNLFSNPNESAQLTTSLFSNLTSTKKSSEENVLFQNQNNYESITPKESSPSKTDLFNPQKNDLFNSSKTNMFNPQKTDIFNPQKTDLFNSQKTDLFNSQKTDLFNTSKTDTFNTQNTDLFKSQKTDLFSTKQNLFSNADKGGIIVQKPNDKPLKTLKTDIFTKINRIGDYQHHEQVEQGQIKQIRSFPDLPCYRNTKADQISKTMSTRNKHQKEEEDEVEEQAIERSRTYINMASFKAKSLKNEDIQKIYSFFSTVNSIAFIASLDHFLVVFKLRLFIQILPYQINYEDLVFQYTDKPEFKQAKQGDDEMVACSQCLSLTFAEPLRSIPIVIKFILTRNSYIAIESESPLIGTYQNPNIAERKFDRHFMSAYRCSELKNIFGNNFQLQQCCSFQKQTSIILKLLENQKQLSVLNLNLEDSLFPYCKKFEKIQHEYFKNLIYISFSSRNNKFRDRHQPKPYIQFYFRYLRQFISLFRKVNSVSFYLKTLGNQQEIKLKNQMYKIRYLVSFNIQEQEY